MDEYRPMMTFFPFPDSFDPNDGCPDGELLVWASIDVRTFRTSVDVRAVYDKNAPSTFMDSR